MMVPTDATEMNSLAECWQAGRFRIDVNTPKVMGIVNTTPDSFSDGGSYTELSQAMRHCEALLQSGADMLDIGGESTRPGSPAVPLEIELQRVLPLVREATKLGVPISVDTYKADVMQQVLDAGVDIINDIWSLRQPGALDVVSGHPHCGVCLMHMHKNPQTMQAQPMSGSVLQEVLDFLQVQARRLVEAGIDQQRVVLDPGIGFGKTVTQNFELLAKQSELLRLGLPILAGWSRKSSLGVVTGRDVSQRIPASIAAALLAVQNGARIVRVHDVAETVDAIKVWQATRIDKTSR